MIIVKGVPIYWGIETEPLDRSFITRSTLHEVLPPFRQSVRAFRIRVSHAHWLHLGVFYYDREARRYGLDASPGEISRWGQDAAQEDDYDDSALVSVRPAQPVGSDRSHRIFDDEEWGDVPGVESFRTGSGVGAGPAGDADGAAAGCDQGVAAEG